MKTDDVTVTIRAVDKVSPVLRRVGWNLFIFRHGTEVIVAMALVILVLSVILAFVLGRISA
jgi:hypothetical protein